MTFEFESALDSFLDSMEDADGITVTLREKISPRAPVDYAESVQELEGINENIPSGIAGNYLMESERIHIGWFRDDYGLAGEFAVKSLHSCLASENLTFEDSRLTAEQREIMGELKIFEETPGNGRMTGLRIPDSAAPPEIWLYDISQPRMEKLDIGFTAYLDALLTTKGVPGWQHLFVENDLRSDEFRSTVNDLKEMLNYLPQLFPEHDYDALRDRLEARL